MKKSISGAARISSLGAITAVIAASIIGYATTFDWMLPVWTDGGSHYSHALLVIALVGFRLWHDRESIANTQLNGASLWFQFLALFAASTAWLLSALSGVQVPGTFAALVVMWVGLSIVFGRGSIWRLLPYFVLLYSIVPVWHPVLNPTLQMIATQVVNTVLQSFELTIYMENNSIFMPNMAFEIVGGCSGIGYILVAVTISIYLALAEQLKLAQGLILLAAFACLAILSNWIRITLIMLVGYFEGPEHPLVDDHIWFGWVVFSVIFLPALWYLPSRLIGTHETKPVAASEEGLPRSITPKMLMLVLGLMLMMPLISVVLSGVAAIKTIEAEWFVPNRSANFSLIDSSVLWQPKFPSASSQRFQAFQHTGKSDARLVYLFQAFYESQRDGYEVVDSQNDLAGSGWTRDQHEQSSYVDVNGNAPIGVLKMVSDSSTEHLLVWYWYQIGDKRVSSDVAAKAYQVLEKFKFRPDASIVAIAAMCSSVNCNGARVLLTEFMQDLEIE